TEEYISIDCCDSCFFFSSRRRHTRFSRDWSSDVCSSDLLHASRPMPAQCGSHSCQESLQSESGRMRPLQAGTMSRRLSLFGTPEIGRASCRESVDLGGRRDSKKCKDS